MRYFLDVNLDSERKMYNIPLAGKCYNCSYINILYSAKKKNGEFVGVCLNCINQHNIPIRQADGTL